MSPDMRDTINEALSDAICDAEGRGDADHLVHHLAKRGLCIVGRDFRLKSDNLRPAFTEWYRHCFSSEPDAVEWASDQYEGATFRSIIEWLALGRGAVALNKTDDESALFKDVTATLNKPTTPPRQAR